MWASDSSRTACNRCGSEFSFTNRRHHCRHCGSLQCGKCSDYFVPMNNPLANPSTFFASDPTSGVHRTCFSCYHRFYCSVCVWIGLFGSLKSEVVASEEDGKKYLENEKKALLMHGGTGKVQWSAGVDNDLERFLEKARGKMRKIMGEQFYAEQEAMARGVPAPSLKKLVPDDSGRVSNQQYASSMQPQQQPQQNNRGAAPAAAASAAAVASSRPPQPQPRPNNNINNNNNKDSNKDSNAPPLPVFTFVACICLEGGDVQVRFLQPDVHRDAPKLVFEFQELAREEFDANTDRRCVEACVLFHPDWHTPLVCETLRFFYRAAPYVELCRERLDRERFVLVAHTGGRAEATVVTGLAAARAALRDTADRGISAVAVAGTGEPIGHSCRDVSWRRDLVDRADRDALRLLYAGSQGRVAFVASTIPSANCEVRLSETLWELEQATAGQLRTTVCGWVWDAELRGRRCVVAPFFAGSTAPAEAGIGVLDSATSKLRRMCAVAKSAAETPTPAAGGSGAAVAAASSGPVAAASAAAAAKYSAEAAPAARGARAAAVGGLAAPPPRPGAMAASPASSPGMPAPPFTPAAAPASPASPIKVPECGICMEPFDVGARKPLVLPCCGVSICAGCAAGVRQRAGKEARFLACPMCRGDIPAGQQLVPNRTLLDQMS